MGISLGDIGAFATGVIDADTKATEERLKDRREELKADRQFYIDMKTKKYESELANFEAENKKYKAIEAVKSKFVGQEPSRSQFGEAYLQETNPTLLYQMQKDFQDNPTGLQKQLALYANADFKTTTTREALDSKLKADVDSITADYKKQLENARGDSKLIKALLGKRDKEIADTIQKNEDGKTGVVVAKEIAVETDTDTKDTFKYGEEKEIKFTVPKKFLEDGKIETKITELYKDDSQLSYNKGAVASTLSFFNDNDIAKPQVFYKKNSQTDTIEGFTGAGAKLNEHITQLWGGAADSFTPEKVYIATNGKATLAGSVLNSKNVKNTIDERIRNYTYVEQPKTWFKDRESIVGIVPWSVVDVNNNIGDFNIKGKANQKLVAQAYVAALKDYTKENNITSEGSIIEPNQKFMNDVQSTLLAQKGNESDLSIDIQNRILSKLGVNEQAPVVKDTSTSSVEGTITIIRDNGTKIENVQDNEENRKLAEEKGFTIQENKTEEITSKSSNVSTKANETRVDEDTDEGMLNESRIEILTNLATNNNISDEELLEFGDMVKLNKVPRTLRTRLFKLKMARQKKINDERRKKFNEKVKNKNKQVSSIETIDENADV